MLFVSSAISLAACAGEAPFHGRLHSDVKHIVIVIQENRSFDNLFHDFPGADTSDYGYAHDGTRVRLEPVSLTAAYDVSNNYRDFTRSYDNGKMDGFDLRRVGPRGGSRIPLIASQYPQYAYVPAREVQPYFDLAKQYVLADRMFQSNIDQSFAAHLYLIAAQAGGAADVPDGRPWGCDAKSGTTVIVLGKNRKEHGRRFPCFDFRTLADELDAARATWRYYAPKVDSSTVWQRFQLRARTGKRHPHPPEFGQNWSSYDAIAHQRYCPDWDTNIVSPPAQFFQDVHKGALADVTWIVPDWRDSDHSLSRSDTGPSWVGSIVDAVGQSRYWASTVVFVIWDDSGGWYDHVPPPQKDFDGLGVRVPLLVVSPYAKLGHVTHVQYEAASLVRFVESTFGLAPLAESDRRANDLRDCFDFNQQPRTFRKIPVKYDESYFVHEPATFVPPDTD